MEYSLHEELRYVLQDNTNAAMDHVFAIRRASPKAVLATS